MLPALGPYPYLGLTPDAVPDIVTKAAWRTPPIMEALRSGELVLIHPPSARWHRHLPKLSRRIRPAVRLGFLGPSLDSVARRRSLNATMFLATVPIGGHYVVDILAGAVVAVLTIKAVLAFEERAQSSCPPDRANTALA